MRSMPCPHTQHTSHTPHTHTPTPSCSTAIAPPATQRPAALLALAQSEAGVLCLARSDYVAFLRMWPREDAVGYPVTRDGGPLAAWLAWRIEERLNHRAVVRVSESTCGMHFVGWPMVTLVLPEWASAHQRIVSAQPTRRWTAGELLRLLAEDERAQVRAAGQRPTVARGFATIRHALEYLLDGAPDERIAALREAVWSGHVDGASWSGTSRCVLGWLETEETERSYLVEAFVYFVHPGETPETNGRLRRILAWIDAWQAQLDAVAPDEEALDAHSGQDAVCVGMTIQRTRGGRADARRTRGGAQ